jgi:hypothetical protein
MNDDYLYLMDVEIPYQKELLRRSQIVAYLQAAKTGLIKIEPPKKITWSDKIRSFLWGTKINEQPSNLGDEKNFGQIPINLREKSSIYSGGSVYPFNTTSLKAKVSTSLKETSFCSSGILKQTIAC